MVIGASKGGPHHERKEEACAFTIVQRRTSRAERLPGVVVGPAPDNGEAKAQRRADMLE